MLNWTYICELARAHVQLSWRSQPVLRARAQVGSATWAEIGTGESLNENEDFKRCVCWLNTLNHLYSSYFKYYGRYFKWSLMFNGIKLNQIHHVPINVNINFICGWDLVTVIICLNNSFLNVPMRSHLAASTVFIKTLTTFCVWLNVSIDLKLLIETFQTFHICLNVNGDFKMFIETNQTI
jgi:hypothetical protein